MGSLGIARPTAWLDAGSALAAVAFWFAASALCARVDITEQLFSAVASHSNSDGHGSGSVKSLLSRIGRTRLAGRFPGQARLRRRLELAGAVVSMEAVLGTRVVAAVVATALVVLLGIGAKFSAVLLALAMPAGLAASRLPDFVIARRAHRRQVRMSARVADLAEILVATTGAGLNPSLAFRRSAEVLEGPLGEELRAAVRGLDLGAPWRTVLDELAVRTGDVSIGRLVRAMGRSQRLGTSLTSALQNVAEDLRTERQARAEELARRAPVKMLFPLVFLILPSFLLLTVGPVLLATLRSLH